MPGMNIPAGYAVLTAGLTGLALIFLVAAGWSRKWTVVSAAVGFGVITSIFVIDVITDGTVMDFQLALILTGSGLALMAPVVLGVLGHKPRSAKSGRPANPPDSARRPAAG